MERTWSFYVTPERRAVSKKQQQQQKETWKDKQKTKQMPRKNKGFLEESLFLGINERINQVSLDLIITECKDKEKNI